MITNAGRQIRIIKPQNSKRLSCDILEGLIDLEALIDSAVEDGVTG